MHGRVAQGDGLAGLQSCLVLVVKDVQTSLYADVLELPQQRPQPPVGAHGATLAVEACLLGVEPDDVRVAVAIDCHRIPRPGAEHDSAEANLFRLLLLILNLHVGVALVLFGNHAVFQEVL